MKKEKIHCDFFFFYMQIMKNGVYCNYSLNEKIKTSARKL